MAEATASRTATAEPGIIPVEEMRRMNGLDLLRSLTEQMLPRPPIGVSLDFEAVEFEHGKALFVGRPHFRFYNPLGSVHGGWISTLLDSCMGCAIHTTLAAGQGYTTVELKVNFVRAVRAETGEVRAEGTVVSTGSRIATAEGRLVDAAGRLYAHGTTTCLIFPI